MKRQLTLQEYRSIDLTLFALILAFSEYVITTAANSWFTGELYTVSVTGAVCAIVMMRWGPWAGIHAAVGGVIFCLASHARAEQYIIYSVGNLAGLGAMLLIRRIGSEKLRTDKLLRILFGLCTVLLMQLGRAAAALILGNEPGVCVGFFTTDALSDLFAMVIVYVAGQLDGIFENQKSYLIRLQNQQKKGKGGF